MAGADEYAKMSDSEKKKEDWMNSKWRPMMGWLYMVVCFCDFVAFPVLYAVYISLLYKGAVPAGVPSQWNPLTLQGAGLFHLAMGAVLGLAAWGRTQEKLGGANNGGLQTATTLPAGQPATFGAASSGPSSFGAAASTGGFGASSAGGFSGGGFGSVPSTRSEPTFSNDSAGGGFGQVATGFGGKPAPVQPPQPLI